MYKLQLLEFLKDHEVKKVIKAIIIEHQNDEQIKKDASI